MVRKRGQGAQKRKQKEEQIRDSVFGVVLGALGAKSRLPGGVAEIPGGGVPVAWGHAFSIDFEEIEVFG